MKHLMGGRKIPAFIYSKNTKDPQPVIISIHGGPEGQARPSLAAHISYGWPI